VPSALSLQLDSLARILKISENGQEVIVAIT